MNGRSRPEGAAPETSFAGDTSTVRHQGDKNEVARQLRRRRAASYRCPILADGRRDTLDRGRRRVVTVRAIGSRTVEFTGVDAAVYGAIKTVGARYQRSPRGRAWLVEQSGAEDVIALLEHRGYHLDVTL